ncbi:2Fe-2S iron-sulfur cluster binding domain-containing protein, partial [Myxococcota bacterium]|nr:2Fe-2S iron-sulfur cluster binding domain-containing protein [Myxococcota bacterium]
MDFSFSELIISVLVVTGIATFLAILIVIADATIGDFGEKTITINDDKKYVVEGGQSLLNALKEQSIFIPSACGGKGTCGVCKVEVHAGGGALLPTEQSHISPREARAGT